VKAKRIPQPSSHPPALTDALQPRLACHGQGQRQAGACRRQLGRRAGGVHPSSHPIFASATRPQDYSTHGKRSIETKHNIVPQPIQHACTPISTAPAVPLLARAASPASAQDAPLVIRPPGESSTQPCDLTPASQPVWRPTSSPPSCFDGSCNTRRSLALLRHRAWPDLSHGNCHPTHAVSNCDSELIL
jgi:hypothetical protein